MSQSSSEYEQLGWFGKLVGAVALLYLVFKVFIIPALPVSLYLISCIAGVILTARLKDSNPWRKATQKVLGCASVGFLLLIIVLFFINWIVKDEQLDYTTVSWIDNELIALNVRAKEAGDLGIYRWLLLFALIPLARLSDHHRLVTVGKSVKEAFSRGLIVLTVVTSFSFISDDSVSGYVSDGLINSIRIQYGQNTQMAIESVAVSFSARAAANAIVSMPGARMKYLGELSKVGEKEESIHRWDPPYFKPYSVWEAATTLFIGPEGSPDLVIETPFVSDRSIRKAPRETLQASIDLKEYANKVMERQTNLAVEEIMKAVLAVVPDAAKDFLGDWVRDFIDGRYSMFTSAATKYLGEISDEYFDKTTEPLVIRSAKKLITLANRSWVNRDPLTEEQALVIQFPAIAKEIRTRIAESHAKAQMERDVMIYGKDEDGRPNYKVRSEILPKK